MGVIEQRKNTNNQTSNKNVRDVLMQGHQGAANVTFGVVSPIIGFVVNNSGVGGTANIIYADDATNTVHLMYLNPGANPYIVKQINSGGDLAAADLKIVH